jgi:hypothetical protein
VHLSNFTIQKQGTKASFCKDNQEKRLGEGCLLFNNLREKEDDFLWTEDEILSDPIMASMGLTHDLWEKKVRTGMRSIAATVAESVLPQWADESSCGKARCFELLGLDIIVDQDLNPWLLEANLSPGLSRRGDRNPTHCARIDKMLSGIVDITTGLWFPDTTSGEKVCDPPESDAPSSAQSQFDADFGQSSVNVSGAWKLVYEGSSAQLGLFRIDADVCLARAQSENGDSLFIEGRGLGVRDLLNAESNWRKRWAIEGLIHLV